MAQCWEKSKLRMALVYLTKLCRKEKMKLLVLGKLSKLASLKQNRILMKTCFESQFGYFPDIWIFHVRKIKRKISHLR